MGVDAVCFQGMDEDPIPGRGAAAAALAPDAPRTLGEEAAGSPQAYLSSGAVSIGLTAGSASVSQVQTVQEGLHHQRLCRCSQETWEGEPL